MVFYGDILFTRSKRYQLHILPDMRLGIKFFGDKIFTPDVLFAQQHQLIQRFYGNNSVLFEQCQHLPVFGRHVHFAFYNVYNDRYISDRSAHIMANDGEELVLHVIEVFQLLLLLLQVVVQVLRPAEVVEQNT